MIWPKKVPKTYVDLHNTGTPATQLDPYATVPIDAATLAHVYSSEPPEPPEPPPVIEIAANVKKLQLGRSYTYYDQKGRECTYHRVLGGYLVEFNDCAPVFLSEREVGSVGQE